ncbi:MAG: biotin synthase BioB [Bacteroidales bacterium]|nr:biotin synthase BioB [Bacteroidales bacterium]
MNFAQIKELKDKILGGYQITKEDALKLVSTENLEALYYSANQIRAKFCGEYFEMWSVYHQNLGRCENDCTFCPMSNVTKVDYYATCDETCNIETVEKQAESMRILRAQGVRKVEIDSTHSSLNDENLSKMICMLNAIKNKVDIELCASFGILSREQLIRLKNETNINYYHCNIETSESFYHNVCTTIKPEDKYETLKTAKSLGFYTCSGGIIGLGESMEDRIDMALKLRSLNVDAISLNIMLPFPGTPLEKQARLSNQEILTTFAIFRFINPKAKLRFARGRSMIKIIEKEALKTGMNSSIVGELLVNAKGADIRNDIQLFESEGFIIRK